jgi:hypothetical protein
MESSVDRHGSLYERLYEIAFPVFLGSDGQPVLVLGGNPRLPKVIIVSIPRSGTHLASRLVAAIGFVSSGLHLSPDGTPATLQDRRFLRPAAEPSGVWKNYELSLTDVLLLLRPGQYTQGHIPFPSNVAPLLHGTKVVYASRELRNVAISAMRFIEDLHKHGTKFTEDLDVSWCGTADGPEKVLKYLYSFGQGWPTLIEAISPWRNLPETFVLDFDRIGGSRDHFDDSVGHLTELARFLGVELSEDRKMNILTGIIGKGSATWSGDLSDYERYWDQRVEETFRALCIETHKGAPDSATIGLQSAGKLRGGEGL